MECAADKDIFNRGGTINEIREREMNYFEKNISSPNTLISYFGILEKLGLVKMVNIRNSIIYLLRTEFIDGVVDDNSTIEEVVDGELFTELKRMVTRLISFQGGHTLIVSRSKQVNIVTNQPRQIKIGHLTDIQLNFSALYEALQLEDPDMVREEIMNIGKYPGRIHDYLIKSGFDLKTKKSEDIEIIESMITILNMFTLFVDTTNKRGNSKNFG
jgi:hypothetical protein